jgi:pimeloyl-ACP methyl ester carboxylesterase
MDSQGRGTAAVVQAGMPRRVGAALICLTFIIAAASTDLIQARHGAPAGAWRDPSPHRVQMVPVEMESGLKLEVLDWGGTGQPIVLLAGLGNTAHVFDELAPQLTAHGHVYGLTRRGFGASGVPKHGYDADHLADDVAAVLTELNIAHPVLVGHSIAGEELSSIAERYPEQVAGLVYLEAAYGYAYYDRVLGDLDVDVAEFRRHLDALSRTRFERGQEPPPGLAHQLRSVQKLVASYVRASDEDDAKKTIARAQKIERELPAIERAIRAWRPDADGPLVSLDLPGLSRGLAKLCADLHDTPTPPEPDPTSADLASYAAFRAWNQKVDGIAPPESELRQAFSTNRKGAISGYRFDPAVATAIDAGIRRYPAIDSVPTLAIYAIPTMASEAKDQVAQAAAFEQAHPHARIVRLTGANHYVFLSNAGDVLAEMATFLRTLQLDR